MVKSTKLVKVLLYALQDPTVLVNFDYRVCSWYKEGKIVRSDYGQVIAYKDGYKQRFKIQVYQFHNVPHREAAMQKLVQYVKDRPHKYRGWLHHMNLYSQMGNGYQGRINIP